MAPQKKTVEEEDTLATAEASLKNPHPAERAHGVVSLTKLARAFVQKKDSRVSKLVVEVSEEEESLDWRPLARVCVKALGDDESYVFLAAAHALSAIADAAPGEVMPYLLEQFETEKREKTRRRLGEALGEAQVLLRPQRHPLLLPAGRVFVGWVADAVAQRAEVAGAAERGREGLRRLRVAGGPQWLTLRHPFDAACTTESAPNRTDCAASEASAACLSEGQRPTALLLFVLLLAAAGLRELWRAVRRARAGGLRKLPLAQVARGLLLLAGTLPFRLCGGLAEGCGDKAFRYAGFEDARAVTHGGELYLIANHEDCHGRRRLCLLKLGLTGGDGDGGGGLQQAHVWPLRIDGVELHDVEKNWSPFVHDGELLMSYSVEPHVVLRCAWVGGACEVAHNSSNPFLATYLTLGQVLRGGTPYARLGDGSLLGAMHVKDGAHAPALYHTIFYLVDGTPPFRVRSLSPKLCFSRRPAELPLSPTCALQYAVGLAVDEAADVALVSLGEMDRRMKVAALPLARTLALARTHMLHDAEVAESDCVAWG